jgi:hypothetical protein
MERKLTQALFRERLAFSRIRTSEILGTAGDVAGSLSSDLDLP